MQRHDFRDNLHATVSFVGAAAYVIVVSAVIAIAAVVLSTGVRGETRCETAPADKQSYWSWRSIDGRRCWYRGESVKPKSQLFWGRRASPPPANREPREHRLREHRDPLFQYRAEEPNEIDIMVPEKFPDIIEERPFGPWEERIMGAFSHEP